MSKDKTVFDLLTGDIETGTQEKGVQSSTITINDAVSESAKILVKEFGSDLEYQQEGKVDVRRMSNVRPQDVFWLMYFQNIPKEYGGDYTSKLCEAFLNNRYSVGGEHKKLSIQFQESLTGTRESSDERKDKRNFIQRHITERGKPRYE